MAKPASVLSSDTFLTWRTRFNDLLDLAPEVVESTSTPGVNDDITNYEVGTIWVETDVNIAYILVDNTNGAAVWTQLGSTPGALINDGSVPLVANWATGNYQIQFGKTSGAPFTVNAGASSVVTNLNADKVDGIDGADLNSIQWTSDTANSNQSVSVGDKKVVRGLTAPRNRTLPSTFALTDRDIIIVNSSSYVISIVPNTGDNIISNGIDLGTSNSMGINPGTAVRLIPDNANTTWVALTFGNPFFVPHTAIENFSAYTLFMNNSASAAGPTDTKISALTEEASPSAGDWLLSEADTGELRKINYNSVLPADNSITNTKLSNMTGWTVKLRNSAASGDPQDVAISSLTEELTPAAGDWLLGEASTGELRKINVGNIDTTQADDSITNAKLSNMAAWTLKLRNSASAGDPGDVKISALTEESTPAAGDWFLGEASTGELRKINYSSIIGADSMANKDFWTGTQASYDAIGTPDTNTIYFVTA